MDRVQSDLRRRSEEWEEGNVIGFNDGRWKGNEDQEMYAV
jgi:hypothetical protein